MFQFGALLLALLLVTIISAPLTILVKIIFGGLLFSVEFGIAFLIRTQYKTDREALWPMFHYSWNIIVLLCTLPWLDYDVRTAYWLFGLGTVIFVLLVLQNIIISPIEKILKWFKDFEKEN